MLFPLLQTRKSRVATFFRIIAGLMIKIRWTGRWMDSENQVQKIIFILQIFARPIEPATVKLRSQGH